MNKITSYLMCITFLFCASHPMTFAQQVKQKVEKSIHQDEIPAYALTLLNQFWIEPKKADFYRESDGRQISYEAKFDWKGHHYSIEFAEDGTLHDIEQLLSFDELEPALQAPITDYLKDQYTKFRITRVQRQFTSDEQVLLENFLNENHQELTTLYELEVEAQNKHELGAFEFLFNSNGELIRKRKIVRRSLDNIW